MPITGYVKNKRNNILPQNRCQLALLFKDGGGLANHPLSCHPQGVFGRWENVRKGKKMKEKGSSGITPASVFSSSRTKKILITRFVLRLYIAPNRKKIPKYPQNTIIHGGKKWEKGSQKEPKVKNAGGIFAQGCKIAYVLFFSLSSTPPFLLISDMQSWDLNVQIGLIRLIST